MLTPTERMTIAANIVEREGGVVNHPKDPGGLTKFGISQRAYPDLDILSLTKAQAVAIYLRDYLHKYRLHELTNARNAEIVCDWLVNGANISKLQRLLKVTEDGTIGPETLKAIDTIDSHALLLGRLDYYVGLVPHPFLRGWVNRLRSLGL